MSSIDFIFSSESISNSYYERQDEKNILLLPFLFDAWNDLNLKVVNLSGKNVLTFEINKKISIEEFKKAVKKPLPEFFDCESIKIQTSNGTFKIVAPRYFLDSKSPSNKINIEKIDNINSKFFSIELFGYGSNRFNALMNQEAISEFYSENSIIKYSSNQIKLNINYFSKNFIIEFENIDKELANKENLETKKIIDGDMEISFKFWNNKDATLNEKELIFLSNNFKIDISKNTYFQEIEKKINKFFISNIPQTDRFFSYKIIFKSNNLNLDEKFKIVNNSDFLDKVNSISDNLENYLETLDTAKIIENAEIYSLELQAYKLNMRKDNLRSSKKVYINNTLIFRVPENEQETVLLFIKLSTLKKIPIFNVNVLEYSTSEGIDAIADVQLDESSPIEKDCLIEFEPTFSQFKSHKHPPKHVDYVICWKVEDHWKKNLKKISNWLYSFNLENFSKTIKVVEISKFENLEIKL